MLILDSCLALNLSNSGCCVWSLSQNCRNNGCYCDQICHFFNDCCNDVTNIGCHPHSSISPMVSPTPTDTLGKTKQELMQQFLKNLFFLILFSLFFILSGSSSGLHLESSLGFDLNGT